MCNTLTQPAPAMVPEDQRLNVVQQLQQLQQVRLQPMPKQKEPAQVPKEAEKQLQQPQPTDVLQVRWRTLLLTTHSFTRLTSTISSCSAKYI